MIASYYRSHILTDDSKLLQESNFTAGQPRRAPLHVIPATTNEGLAQGPEVTAIVGFELAAEGTDPTTEPTHL